MHLEIKQLCIKYYKYINENKILELRDYLLKFKRRILYIALKGPF
jgi:hypothetical protein